MRILLRKIFHRACDSAIGVAFPQNRIHRTAEHFCVTAADFLFIFRRLFAGEIRNVKAVVLQFLNRSVVLF